MPKISVVVPIYNAEKKLERSVNSILNQTEKDMEIILVDDGSQDRSLEICQKYAKRDKRILVIHQENQGVSAARNTGMYVAKGEFIGFVDADDWIAPTMYKKLITEAYSSKSDIIICDANTVFSNGKQQIDTITQLEKSTILKKNDFTPALLLEMAGSVCRCIYKSSICCTRIQFPLGVKFSEDRIFNLYAIGSCKSVSYIKEAYYNRFINAQSAVHRFHEDYFEAIKKSAYATKVAIRDSWGNDTEMQIAYLRQFIDGTFAAINNYYYKTSTLSSRQREKKVKMICEDEQLRNAIEEYGSNWHSQWILEKKVNLLILYAKMANHKHRR